ncbi:MAG: EAL domain-containing protein [Verrucomicrobiota bacterium]
MGPELRRLKQQRAQDAGRLSQKLLSRTADPADPDTESAEIQERFAALGKNGSDLICELGCDLRFLYASPNFREILHYKPSGLLGKDFLEFVHPEDTNAVSEELSKLMVGVGSSRLLFRMVDGNGEWRWMDTSGKAYCASNGEARSVFISRDVTEQRQMEEQHTLLASRDSATVLYNKPYFVEHLIKSAEAAQHGAPSAVVYVDLDGFKLINDRCGHLAGDRLIVAIASILHEVTPENGLLARFGGDEFLYLLRKVSGIEDAVALGEEIRARLNSYRFIDAGTAYSVTASMGAVLVDGSVNSREVINRANAASSSAKTMGGNRLEVYTQDGSSRGGFREALRWSDRVLDGLRAGKFELWYQPVVHLGTRRADHYEALIRLKEHNGQVYSPSMFLNCAERFGYLEMLDRYVVEHAFQYLVRHSDRRVAVILSGISFTKPDLAALIVDLVAQLSLDPSRLIVQIPWPNLLSTFEAVRDAFARLREASVRIGIKNFRADFSSVQYLRDFPVNYLKLDGELMRDFMDSSLNQAAVSAINDIGHALNADTIAEFVDDLATLERLREIGIDYAKGHYLGQAEPE